MNLEKAYQISKRGVVDEEEAAEVISYYIYMLKGKNVKVKCPKHNPRTNALEGLQMQERYKLLMDGYRLASCFIITYKEHPHLIKVKVHA